MEPSVVELDLGVLPNPNNPAELLLASGWGCRLVFRPASYGEVRPQTAVVTFEHCVQTVFGYPNDEAQGAHPLYGDCAHGFYEVIGSDWPRRLEAFNRLSFPDTKLDWFASRHFLLATKESFVEILAGDIAVEVHDRPFDAVALDVLRDIPH